MDIIIGVLSLILAIVCGVVVYFISVSSMREKTYDEVKAEQKKKTEEYLAPGRTTKDKAKDKKVKKAVKKSKEAQKTVQTGPAEVLKESESDENQGAPEQSRVQQITKDQAQEDPKVNIIESSQHIKKQTENKINLPSKAINVADHPQKSSKPSVQKPAEKAVKIVKSAQQEEPPVHSKLDQKPKAQSTNIQENQKPKAQSSNIQENQVKLKVVDKVTETKPKNLEKVADNQNHHQQQPQQQHQQQIVKEVTTKTNAKPPSSSSSGGGNLQSLTKIPRKKRNEISALHQINGDKESVDASVLTALVHKSEMSGAEIQALIECLLNKQLDSAGATVNGADWTEGRQDPVVRLKKQLAEKEKAVAEEQEAMVALQSKLRDLRNELNAARSAARHHEEALAATQTELGTRLQHATDEKQSLLQQIQQLQRKLSEEHRLLCQTQAEHEQQLQHELLAQRQQLEVHITRLTEQHQEEVRTELDHLMAKLQYETGRLQAEVNQLTEQLNAKRADADQLAAAVQALQADNARLSAQISSACVEAQQLRDENESLAAQMETQLEQRPATEGRENGDGQGQWDAATAPHSAPSADSDKMSDATVLVEKLREDLDSLEKELSRCKAELAQRELLVSELECDLDGVRKEHESKIQEHKSTIKALREERDSAARLAGTGKAEVARLGSQLESREGTIEALKSELNTHKTRIADQAVTIEALRAAQTTQTTETDTKEMDDLRRAVDAHRSQITDRDAKITALTTQVAAYEADVTRLRDERTTLCQQLDSVKSEKQPSTGAESGQSSLDDLLEQNSALQSLVAHYKAIIGDTEAMLNQLQQHVEREETRWRHQMRALQAQLDDRQAAPSDSPSP